MTANNDNKKKPDWWLVVTKPQGELKSQRHLMEQGFTVYFPRYKKESLRGRQVKIQTVPLFPRYIFIEANDLARRQVHVIKSTLGVSQLLKISEVPMCVPATLIENLKLLESEQMGVSASHFKAGDRLVIIDGPYSGLEAVYAMDDGLQRGVVLITLLQKATRLSVDKKQLRNG